MSKSRLAPLDHHTLEKYENIWLGLAVVMVFLLFTGVVASMISGTFPSLSNQSHNMINKSGRIDPSKLDQTPFAKPGIIKTDQGLEAYIVAKAFTFDPPILRVPSGKEIIIHVTSTDVIHGFQVTGTNINVAIIPGHVASFKITFHKNSNQNVICNEYCGLGHQNMVTKFIIEDMKESE